MKTDFTFKVTSPYEEWRAKTAFVKEMGTVQWIEDEVGPADVFYDIGANVGIYTVMAASKGATVYAFEPHQLNAKHLTDNVWLNHYQGLVTVLPIALHSEAGFLAFNYKSQMAGTSGSQLGCTQDEFGRPFEPSSVEQVYANTVDALLAAGTIRPATLIKLDVDGNELFVLKGMVGLLQTIPPRQIQVEVHPRDDEQIVEFMDGWDYRVALRHFTQGGKESLTQGYTQAQISHNIIFRLDRGTIAA